MPLVDPNKKTGSFNPNTDNSEVKVKANIVGTVITYISFILIIPFIMYIIKRNKLVNLQMKINEASSGIDVQLKKRKDTLIKLVAAVKGSMEFEKETQKEIVKLRGTGKQTTQEVMDTTARVGRAINVAVEAYPQLQSTKSVQNLMNSSSDIELEIAASRRLYNSKVTNFNSEIFAWPGSVVATSMHLGKLPLFAASEEDKKDVEIKFK